MEIKAYELIQDFYPELVVIIKNKLYFNDQNISKYSLLPIKRIQGYDLLGHDLNIYLYFNYNTDHTGVLIMKYDFKLSDDAIISLYKHNIKIQYRDSKSPNANVFGIVTYDSRVDLMRRCTISNILDE